MGTSWTPCQTYMSSSELENFVVKFVRIICTACELCEPLSRNICRACEFLRIACQCSQSVQIVRIICRVCKLFANYTFANFLHGVCELCKILQSLQIMLTICRVCKFCANDLQRVCELCEILHTRFCAKFCKLTLSHNFQGTCELHDVRQRNVIAAGLFERFVPVRRRSYLDPPPLQLSVIAINLNCPGN
jgi:hypothetical protein